MMVKPSVQPMSGRNMEPIPGAGPSPQIVSELERLRRERESAEGHKAQLQRELMRSTANLREREWRYREAEKLCAAKENELTTLRQSLDRLDKRLQAALHGAELPDGETLAVRHIEVEALRRMYDTTLESIEVVRFERTRASAEASLLRLQLSTAQNQVAHLQHEQYDIGNMLTRLVMNIAALEKRRADREGSLFLL